MWVYNSLVVNVASNGGSAQFSEFLKTLGEEGCPQFQKQVPVDPFAGDKALVNAWGCPSGATPLGVFKLFPEGNHLRTRFRTKESPPLEWLYVAAAKNPRLGFDLEYVCPGMLLRGRCGISKGIRQAQELLGSKVDVEEFLLTRFEDVSTP